MTSTPGDGDRPEDPYRAPEDQPGQPGHWGQPTGQQPYDPQYGAQPPAYGGPPPYGPPPGYPPMGYAPDHPKATTSLVLGILGVVVCGFIAPFAWRMGKRTVAEIDASQGQLGGRGSAQAGYVLGLIGTVLLGIGLLVFVVYLVVLVVAVSSNGFS